MKSNTEAILSLVALLMVITVAPITTAFAQTTVEASSNTEIEVNDDGIKTSTSTEADVSVSNSDEDEASDETDRKTKDRRQIRDEIKEERQQLRDDLKKYREEKIQDIKERISDQYKDRIKDTVSSDLRPIEADRVPDLTFHGTTEGFMIFGGTAHHSQIDLEGAAYHVQEDMWRIKSHGKISVADKEAKLEMKGYARGNNIVLHGNGELDNGEKVRLFLRGHFAPTQEDGVFAMAFTQASVHNVNTGEKIPLMHVGVVKVDSTNDIESLPPIADLVDEELS